MMFIIQYLISKTNIEQLQRERQLSLTHLSHEHTAYRESD